MIINIDCIYCKKNILYDTLKKKGEKRPRGRPPGSCEFKKKPGRPKMNYEWWCAFCKKLFSTKDSLERHIKVCKKVGSEDYIELKKTYIKEQKKYTKNITKLQEENKKLKEKVLVLTSKLDVIFTTMSKPSILKTGDYEPIILSQQRFDRIVEEKYVYEIFCKCIDGGLLIYAMFLSTGKDGIIQAGIYDDAECELKAYDKLTQQMIKIPIKELWKRASQSKILKFRLNKFSDRRLYSDENYIITKADAELVNTSKNMFLHFNTFKDVLYPKIRGLILGEERLTDNEKEYITEKSFDKENYSDDEDEEEDYDEEIEEGKLQNVEEENSDEDEENKESEEEEESEEESNEEEDEEEDNFKPKYCNKQGYMIKSPEFRKAEYLRLVKKDDSDYEEGEENDYYSSDESY